MTNDPQINQILPYLVVALVVWLVQTLRLSPKRGEEDLANMRAIRQTMNDVLKENSELKTEVRKLRDEVDTFQKENLQLKELVIQLEATLKEFMGKST